MTDKVPVIFQKKLIIEKIHHIHEYVQSETDWLIIKRQLINNFPVDLREKLSTRNPVTKKHTLSQYDKEIIKLWELETGVVLILDPTKKESVE